jgi:hypothetical protein
MGPPEGFGDSFEPINIYYPDQSLVTLVRFFYRCDPNHILQRTWEVGDLFTRRGTRSLPWKSWLMAG